MGWMGGGDKGNVAWRRLWKTIAGVVVLNLLV